MPVSARALALGVFEFVAAERFDYFGVGALVIERNPRLRRGHGLVGRGAQVIGGEDHVVCRRSRPFRSWRERSVSGRNLGAERQLRRLIRLRPRLLTPFRLSLPQLRLRTLRLEFG